MTDVPATEQTFGSLANCFDRSYSGAVYDVLRAMGRDDYMLPPTIVPLGPTRQLAGPVFPLTTRLDETLSAHQTLLVWVAFLSKAPAGQVIACQPRDTALTLMGDSPPKRCIYAACAATWWKGAVPHCHSGALKSRRLSKSLP